MEESQLLLDDTISLTEELTNTTTVRQTFYSISANKIGLNNDNNNVINGYKLNIVQQVELLSSELDQWRPLLRKQVDGLVVGMKMTDALENVYRAESHAHMLQSYAHSMHR